MHNKIDRLGGLLVDGFHYLALRLRADEIVD
ncbi:MAG: hypothetical protein LKCHEGNO_00204 [Burkholderiaceae bacterium]|nr:hypothetical protein [Burkholderiaceae bacterium]